MPDTNFLTSFAEHPYALTLLLVAALVALYMWKVYPLTRGTTSIVQDIKTVAAELQAALHGIRDDIEILKAKAVDAENRDIKQDKQLKYMTRDTLRNIIYLQATPIEDKLMAYFRYIECGGNGKVEEYVCTQLVPGNEGLFEAIKHIHEEKENVSGSFN